MNRTIRAIIACVFIAVIAFSAVSILMNLGRRLRADVTEEKLYTLSEGTRIILGRLNQPVRMTLYYARTAAMNAPDQIQFFNTYFNYVNDLLQEYAAASAGMVEYELVDPRPYTTAEERALAYRLENFPINDEERFFFGLVLETPFGVVKTIPFFSPDRQNFIEYDITSLIDAAVTRDKQNIGIMSPLAVFGDDENPYLFDMMRRQGMQPRRSWPLLTQLRQRYNVHKIETDIEEISGIDLLLVIHPKDFSERTLWAIDQYVLSGGRAVFLVDPQSFYESMQEQQQPQQMQMHTMDRSYASNINRLLNAWGLHMPEGVFAGDSNLAQSVPLRSEAPQPWIGFLQLNRQNMNPDSIITADLDNVMIFFGGVLEKTGDPEAVAANNFVPLIQTTAEGNRWRPQSPYDLMSLQMMDPRRLMRAFTPGTEPVTMGYLVTGRFRSAFPDGLAVDNTAGDPCNGEVERLTGLTEAAADCAVAVYADVDFITDLIAYEYNPFFEAYVTRGDNSALLQNTIEAIAGSTELISLRSRGRFSRPFTLVDEIEREAEAEHAREIETLQNRINMFTRELNQLLAGADGEDQQIVESSILARRDELQEEIRAANEQLRLINLAKRERIDALGNRLRLINMALVPAVVLLGAIALALRRWQLRRRSATR